MPRLNGTNEKETNAAQVRGGGGQIVCSAFVFNGVLLFLGFFCTGIDSLELEKNKLLEENKKFEPILLFYKNKLIRTKTNAEQGLKLLFKDKTFVLVGELNML